MPTTNNANNVTAGKPRVAGSVYRGATSASLPTDATSTIASAFKALGYISEDGVKNNNSPETENIKAWGGDVVLNTLTGKEDTFTFKLIEAMNTDALAAVYGSDNVSGTLSNGITVKANASSSEAAAYVIDMVLKNNVLKRIVIPNATVSEVAEIAYTDNEAVGYEVTITAVPDASGYTHYEYIKQTTPTPVS
jgi:hypothetical protein